jgi:hypothetical protein
MSAVVDSDAPLRTSRTARHPHFAPGDPPCGSGWSEPTLPTHRRSGRLRFAESGGHGLLGRELSLLHDRPRLLRAHRLDALPSAPAARAGLPSCVLMANNHIEIAESIFFPANAGVHSLAAPLTPEQVRVFTQQVQGCLSTMLEAVGY